jgi:hypothetical protein
MRPRFWLVVAVMLAVCFGSLSQIAYARRKDTGKVATRIHFSGNLEGETEPCG